MKELLLFLIIFSASPETIDKNEILEVTEKTKDKIESIESYKFTLVKRELVDGRSTGYQYLNAKVNVNPLKIYLEFTQPEDVAGRRVLYKGRKVAVRCGGNRMPNLVLHIRPDSPLAMMDNRYDITYMNPQKLSKTLVAKIKNELRFPDTKLQKYEDVSVFGQHGILYRLTHKTKQDGMTCFMAEVLIGNKLGLPLYFRVVNFNDTVIEEYAFNHMEINVKFENDEFDEDNPEYRFRQN